MSCMSLLLFDPLQQLATGWMGCKDLAQRYAWGVRGVCEGEGCVRVRGVVGERGYRLVLGSGG